MKIKDSIRHFAAWITLLLLSTSLLVFPLAFAFCWYSPIINATIRQATIAFGVLTLSGLLFVVRKTRWLLGSVIALLVLSALFLICPSTAPHNRASLRSAYVETMRSYKDCPYVWGGEGRFGIDCSGLVRRGLVDALVQDGILHLNPYLVRQGLSLWWHDTTARQIGLGYGGRTHLVTTCNNLNDLDYTQLQPGDMAVTTSGIHVMGYIGNKQWIAADPGAERVVVFDIPEKENSYFRTPMKIIRWRMLEDL